MIMNTKTTMIMLMMMISVNNIVIIIIRIGYVFNIPSHHSHVIRVSQSALF